MSVTEEHPPRAKSQPRPRFSTSIESEPLRLPPGRTFGVLIETARAPNGDLYVLHLGEYDAGLGISLGDPLPPVVRFSPEGDFIEAWGGPDHIPAVNGVSQWPAGVEGLECDADGNLWVFGFAPGDDAILKFSPSGELLLRIGQRGRPGNDDDTQLVGRPTSCYHDVERREVFVSDGYGNHRVIAFNSDTGEFTRMWGAYGKKPSSLSEEESYANPVHKVARGPGGRIYVCDRIKCRVQEFELVPGGARFLREVYVARGTPGYGATFDLAFPPGDKFMYVADGTNNRVWTVDLDSFTVLGWAGVQIEGEDNWPASASLLHRFSLEANGDLLLACTHAGVKRMKYLGVA
jgi:hypothetical protein